MWPKANAIYSSNTAKLPSSNLNGKHIHNSCVLSLHTCADCTQPTALRYILPHYGAAAVFSQPCTPSWINEWIWNLIAHCVTQCADAILGWRNIMSHYYRYYGSEFLFCSHRKYNNNKRKIHSNGYQVPGKFTMETRVTQAMKNAGIEQKMQFIYIKRSLVSNETITSK